MAYGRYGGGGGGYGDRRSSGGFRGRSFGGPREMHKIKCSECGKEDEVPFKPREGTPVYCKDCFMKRKGITPRARPAEATGEATEEAEPSEENEESKE